MVRTLTYGRQMPMTDYPQWMYYPPRSRAPQWVHDFLGVIATARDAIDSFSVEHLTSDAVLSKIAPGLTCLGYSVEAGKKKDQRIRRPVLSACTGKSAWRTRSMPSTMGWACWSRSRRAGVLAATRSTVT